MKFLRASCLLILAALAFVGCYDEPDFGVAPRLTSLDVYFKRDVSRSFDSLVVRVGFEDGDGDLGIIPGEPGFEQFTRIPNSNTDEPYWIYDINDPDLPPYNCVDYEYTTLTENDTIRDTLLVERNEAYYNYGITLYTKEENGYQEIDLNCSPPLGGRYFPLKDDLDLASPLSGIIQYGTLGPYSRFRNDTLKIDVVIRDRAGNVSNVVSKEDFTLGEIERGVVEEG